MAPDPNRTAGGASGSGTTKEAKDEALSKKKVESEDLVSPKGISSSFSFFVFCD